MIMVPVLPRSIRDIQPKLLLLRNELRVHIEAPRPHKVRQLRGLLRRRSVGRRACVLEEEACLGDRELVGGMGVEVGEYRSWEGG